MKTMGKDSLLINHETIDLRYVEQLVDSEQTAALGYILTYAENNLLNGRNDLRSIVTTIRRLVERKGLSALVSGSYLPVNLAMPRDQEIFACFNRYRSFHI